MSDYDAYKVYCALKRHFNSESYDYFKYQGKVRTTHKAFEKRNDKYFFAKLAKHKDIEGFLVANLAYGDMWVGDLVNEQAAEKQYREWLKRKQSMSYVFKNDIDSIGLLKDEMRVVEGQHPKLFKRYLSKEICIETVIILNGLWNGLMFMYWNEMLKDPVWRSEHNKLLKFSPFVQFDRDKYMGMLTESQNQHTITSLVCG